MNMATMTDQECRKALSDLLYRLEDYAENKYKDLDWGAGDKFFTEDLKYDYGDYPQR